MLCYNAIAMDTLSKLFGSTSKVKVIRLFLFNPQITYDTSDISYKAKVGSDSLRPILSQLEKAELIRKKSFFKEYKNKKGKRRISGWTLNEEFPYLRSLQGLLINNNPLTHKEILGFLKNVGKLKLVIVSGVFIQEWDSRVDLFLVGDKIKQGSLERAIKNLEAHIGKELVYSVLDTKEFAYRLNVYDKLVRDILDYPHEKILQRTNLI